MSQTLVYDKMSIIITSVQSESFNRHFKRYLHQTIYHVSPLSLLLLSSLVQMQLIASIHFLKRMIENILVNEIVHISHWGPYQTSLYS